VVEAFTSSIAFDVRLWQYDIEGSVAHAEMLGRQGIITEDEKTLIIQGLRRIDKQMEAGTFQFRDDLEDVHMNIEAALINDIGPTGGKLHTARSRNDQVLLDLRLFLRDEITNIIQAIKTVQQAMSALAEKHLDWIVPGFTHLQRAQPILLSHYFLACWQMLDRDRARLSDCLDRVNVLPLGACAIAGTTLPIDRHYVAQKLQFKAVSKNSLDTVSDRDFALEFLSAGAILMTHLSRFSEDMILWSTWEFGFLQLPDAFSTGSSIMPQKKNPDVPELIRGKAGRVLGNMISLFTTLKGLPMGYNRALQEDTEPIFDTVDTVKACLEVLAAMLPELQFNRQAMEKAAQGGFSLATDLAEYLVKKGVPFRQSHEITGRIVHYCIEHGKTFDDLTMEELQGFSQMIAEDVFSVLRLKTSVDNKTSYGGTSTKGVLEQIREIKDTY
jgi:argininosuccinate lyase